ncbi:hypothetical protein [Paracoccus sp. MKU1]|uniref:hypothetical protein n=1 Tax=Paracoccus sp. MKU1 TaxID=1745182 RepID=UPI0007192DDE|nr:hypothetical protein [Paracoccus sp. MKU1]
MANFKVIRADGAQATITADRFESDGAGTRFYNEDGGVVASFTYGQLTDVYPADVVFEVPVPPAQPED